MIVLHSLRRKAVEVRGLHKSSFHATRRFAVEVSRVWLSLALIFLCSRQTLALSLKLVRNGCFGQIVYQNISITRRLYNSIIK